MEESREPIRIHLLNQAEQSIRYFKRMVTWIFWVHVRRHKNHNHPPRRLPTYPITSTTNMFVAIQQQRSYYYNAVPLTHRVCPSAHTHHCAGCCRQKRTERNNRQKPTGPGWATATRQQGNRANNDSSGRWQMRMARWCALAMVVWQ